LSSIGASVNAKRAACVHLLFNVAGCIIFIFPVAFAGKYIAQFLNSFIAKTEWQIAIFHMCFNLITTLILLPFVNQLVKLACLIVPDKKSEKEEESETLDKRLLKTPAIAVGQTRKQILKMADTAFTNYKLSVDMLISGDLSKKGEFAEREKGIDAMNKYIINFLVQLSLQEISEVDEKKVSSFYHVTSDIERIGDYAENIVEFAEKIHMDNVEFTDSAKDEIREMDSHITSLYGYVCKVFANSDLSFIPDVEREESATDRMNNVMQQSHLQRMNEGLCTPEAGSLFLQLAVNMERIGDHMNNIAHSVSTYGHGAVQAH
jgi:phosphate:Na+ symporter